MHIFPMTGSFCWQGDRIILIIYHPVHGYSAHIKSEMIFVQLHIQHTNIFYHTVCGYSAHNKSEMSHYSPTCIWESFIWVANLMREGYTPPVHPLELETILYESIPLLWNNLQLLFTLWNWKILSFSVYPIHRSIIFSINFYSLFERLL